MDGYKRFALLVFVIIGALLIVGASAGHAAQAQTKGVVAAVAHDFYPEYMVAADGDPGGFAIDLMNAVAKRAGLSVTYRVYEAWSDLIAALERGDADVVPVVSVTRAREARMLFTRSLVTSPAFLFVRQDTDNVRGWADLAGRRVAVIEGGFSAEVLSERNPSARLVPYAGLKHALFDLLSGEVDALVSFESSVWKAAERARVADRVKVIGEPVGEAKRAIAVRQDLPGLRDRLDAAVAEFLDSPEYRKLYSEWYTVAPSFWTPGRSGWLAGASTALLLLGMLFWQSLSLRAESRRLAESAPGQLLGEHVAAEFPTPVISRACGLVALALGLAVLFGWAFDVTALKTMLPGLFAMQPWAAITIALAGVALLLASVPGRIAAAMFLALASAVLISGLQALLQYATGLDFGTDRWFFPEAVANQPSHPHPGRVAEVTSIAFALLGVMLLLAPSARAWARGVFSTIGTIGPFLMAAPLLGYLIGAGILQSAAFFTPIALHAAIGLVVLFLGALTLRPDTGWMALLSGDRPGAATARMLLPVVVIGPLLLAFLFEAGRNAGLYGSEFRLALTTLATIALLGTSLLWSAARVDRLHHARLAAAEALRRSEVRLRRTVENAPFPIMVHAEDGEVVHLSQAWLTLTGYARAEIGTIAAWTERAYGERKEVVRADIDRLYALDRAVDEGEYPVRTADGRMRVWAFSSALLGPDDRGRRLVVSMAADVTERKEAERALRESENRMRALLDASQDEILLVSIGGEVLAINKAAARRLAKRTGGSNPVGGHLDRLLPQDQVEQRMTLVQQVASTATLAHWEVQIRSRWFEFWFYPVLQADKPVSEVAVYAREITEQKKSQAELSKLFQAIQQSPTSVVITDRDGKIEYVNPEFTDVTGYTQAEAIGRNPRILKSGHTPAEQYVELWKTITSGGVWRGELRNKKKNGELFWELASIAPVREGEKITNFVAVKEDITQRKEIEEQLRQSQKMEAVGQLTGGIAHDFNNLLAIIVGNLQLLGERPSSDSKAREYLDDALWSARRGGELTHRLLAFARKQSLQPTVIDFNDVVRGMTDLLRRTLGANIHIEESLAPDLWKAFADRGELERALVNLAVNARDAMRSAGTLTLETRNAVLDENYAEHYQEVTPGEYVLLAVTDTGTGMPPEVVNRVFEPFFTTKEAGQGSGLGLSMVYGFVKQSGGHISIYSRVGQGASVKLYLPRSPSLPAQPEEASPDVLPEGFGEKVVLVVEDEPKLRKMAVKMLDQLGLRSMQAETAKDALKLLADTHVDVLFTDIELPGGMNGIELAEAAQKLAPNIKVLFTTGYARETVLRDKWLQDKPPWLLKPYSHIELARELKALLAPTLH
jgi:two-component system, cell cycle sensor histidine kinase and response regulator CckA